MPSRFSLAFFALLVSSSALAQQADPLWKRAQDNVLASKNLVASAVSVDTVVADDRGNNVDTIHKETVLSQSKDGQPMGSVVKMTEAKQSGLGELKFEWGVANYPEHGLADGTSIVRGERALLDAKACVIFHVQGKKGKMPFTSKAWIEESTGLPLRVDYTVEGVPMAKSLTYSVLYGRDGEARWLPREVKIDAYISAFFYKMKIRSTQHLSNWVARPPSSK